MQEEHGIIGRILAKYPVITNEEQQVLNDWLAKDGNRQKFDIIIDNEVREGDLKRFLQIRKRKEENREKYHQAISDLGTIRGIAWWKKWPTYVAAASILFAVSLISYKWFSGKDKEIEKPVVTQNKDNDVAPGQFKAKLTLDDNTDIVLDSATDKVLLQQAGIKVVNKDGTLVYEYTGTKKDGAVLYNTLTTARGQTYATVLSDGTKVWLNSHSSIRYPMTFNGDIRSVQTTGEVYFEVAVSVAQLATGQKGKRLFIVHAPGVDVEVLGTHFNINSYADEPLIKTTLLEGIVKVVAPANAAQGGERKAVYLAPGEQARLVKQNQALSKTKDVDAEGEAAWRFGMFQFNKADLVTVMRQLGRWYDVEIEYRGNVPEHEFIGTIPRSLNLSKVLQLLEKQDMHFTIDGKRIIVTHK